MPATSKAKNPRGVEIVFTEADHSYTSVINGKTIHYVSGTTFVGKFFPPFDPTGEITRKYAEKRGITVDEVKQLWEDKKNKSCIYGTKVHETMEDLLQNHPLRNTPSDEKEELVFKNAQTLANKILDKFDILGIEKIIFDENIRIAGTIDLLAKSKRDGRIWILDHKTNEKIELENRFKKYAKYPIQHIGDTSYYHYCCQLSLYEYILKEVGYIDKDADVGRCLFHIKEDGVQAYNLKSYDKEIRSMVEYYKKELLNENCI